jgi:predicted TIM-barrel fold metal-dependent hydrolase
MRGARVNLETAGVFDPARAWSEISTTADLIAPHGWHLQTFARLSVIAALAEQLMTLPVPLVIDHFGRPDAARGLMQPGFDALRRLVGSGRGYVKLSAAYRISAQTDCADAAMIARALIAENPQRILWGTDWPHPGGAKRGAEHRDAIEPFFMVDDGAALNRLEAWAGCTDTLRRILVENPARLYGFV